jgi:HAMP domain-containing protein
MKETHSLIENGVLAVIITGFIVSFGILLGIVLGVFIWRLI